jgi:DNA-binding CsgD family transcriptional regulator
MANMRNEHTLSTVSNKLYQAVYDNSQWPDAISSLADALNGSGSCFNYNMVNVSGSCDSYFEETYKQEMWSQDMLSSSMMAESAGSIKTNQMILSTKDFRNSVFFNEWFAPQDTHSSLQIKAFAQDDTACIFTICRGGHQADFDSHDVAFVQALLPTLTNVAALHHKMGQINLSQHGQTLDSVNTGLIIVNQHAHVLHSNALADKLLFAHSSPFAVKDNRLSIANVEKNSLLQKHIFSACQRHNRMNFGREFMIPVAGNPLMKLSIFITPLHHAHLFGLPFDLAASILIRQVGFDYSDENKARIGTLFGLSEQESVIAAHLLKGFSLKEAAKAEDISITTARTYLSRIFRKTNTHHQSQLLPLLTQALAVPTFTPHI